MCSWECPQEESIKIYYLVIEGWTISIFQWHQSAPAINIDVQYQGPAAPQWCKTLAKSLFREEIGNVIQRYVILSWLSKVFDLSHLAEIDVQIPFLVIRLNGLNSISVSICVALSPFCVFLVASWWVQARRRQIWNGPAILLREPRA